MIEEYEVAAYFGGDAMYDRAVSNIPLLEVTKYASTLTCLAASTSIAEGQDVTISGALDPILSGETIALRYQPLSGSAITRTVTTDTYGEYSDTYTPGTTGSWSVTASWDGNATHSDTSASRSFTVGGSGCLVATATFGSELTPQVQFLRGFRDHRVLSTYAGSQFMEVFNSFYYSWSPTVASTIRTSDGFSNIMKVILYPLIGVLQVSEGIFSVMSFSPELAVITAGFAASSLLASIYLVPLGLVISHLTKYRPPKQLIYAIGVIWLASLTAIGIAELTQTSEVMMTATGTFVVTTISATLLTAIQQMPALITAIRSLRPRILIS